MASQRPGFSRVDTDNNVVSLNNLSNNGEGSSKKRDWSTEDGTEMKGVHEIGVGVTEVDEGINPKLYDVEAEDRFGKGEVVHTAMDVVTRKCQ